MVRKAAHQVFYFQLHNVSEGAKLSFTENNILRLISDYRLSICINSLYLNGNCG